MYMYIYIHIYIYKAVKRCYILYLAPAAAAS